MVNRVFDIEIQCKTVSGLSKRTRYYQSMIDMDNLLKGEAYDSLPESFIIFICKKDPFTLNRPQYTFKNLCIEDNSLFLDDKTTKVFYNAERYNDTDNRELRAFLKFVAENQAEDDFTRRLENHVLETIRSDTFRREYMEMTLREHDLLYWGKQEGLEEGAFQKSIEATENFLKENIAPEIISKCIGLPLEKVLEISDQLRMHNA